ncbi:hypothetical protein NSB25_22850 [Acetatifactor muris]|uniref:Lipoprotein LipO n=1 Tax=Acetatifactor muris TaxID=879566 RepID=A0A2K4ZKZ5_9FIRM|nr:hypothetical protein [Acetatifactor muris]MCR2050091.1 hypothetical protein [Acetatifactor muris]SOY31154.1 hypothetical protein AMURIS_03889 [Acetatifactor muris]
MKKRNRYFKKTVTMLTAVAMAAAAMTGCGSTDGGGSEAGPSTDGSGAADSQEALGNQEAAGALDFGSVSDVVFPLPEKVTLDVFVYASNTGGGTMQDNYVTDWIEEQTNIHLNFVYDVDGDEAKTKLNLVMSDPSSMPDIFLATRWSKAETALYAEQGLLLQLDDYLADAKRWNELNEISPSRKGDLTLPDGHIYTYGADGESYHNNFQNRMWIYKPWVDLLNDGKMPETTEELYDFMVKVKTQDPNGNGLNDEVPMTGYIGGWSSDPTVWLINSFIQCNNPLSNTNPTIGAGLAVENGKITYSVMQDAYKDALVYIHRLYKEGLLDTQTFTQDSNQFATTLNEGDHLVALHAAGRNQADKANFDSGKDGDWINWTVLEPVAGPDGVRLAARDLNNYFGSALGILSANCRYPEIAIALFDFLASEEGTRVQSDGPKGFAWDYVTEGTSLGGGTATYKVTKIGDDFDWIGNGFAKEYEHVNWPSDVLIRTDHVAYRSEILVEDTEKNLEYILQKAAERYSVYAPDLDQIVPNIAFDTETAQKISEYSLTIGGYVNQATVQFITGDLDIEKEWDNYLNTLKNMGVEDYLNLYQAQYDNYMANLK